MNREILYNEIFNTLLNTHNDIIINVDEAKGEYEMNGLSDTLCNYISDDNIVNN